MLYYVYIAKYMLGELVPYIYLLSININKYVYFCKAFIFIATTDIKKHKLSLKFIVL